MVTVSDKVLLEEKKGPSPKTIGCTVEAKVRQWLNRNKYRGPWSGTIWGG